MVPEWKPGDIDVFCPLPETDFVEMVEEFVAQHESQILSVRKRLGIVDVELHSQTVTLSFVRCRSPPEDVIQQFDIDICQVMVHLHAHVIVVTMPNAVMGSIRDREMRCVLRKRSNAYMHYPLQRTLHRLRKYQARGFFIRSICFESTTHIDFPEHDLEVSPDDFGAIAVGEVARE